MWCVFGWRDASLRLGAAALFLWLLAWGQAARAADQVLSVDFDMVAAKARAMASRPYEPPPPLPSDLLLRIGYDAWRDIRFRPEKSPWNGKGLPFDLQFFHPGFYYDRTVAMHLVENGKALTLRGTRDMFSYGRNPFAPGMPEEVGLAGFRVHAPLNVSTYHDEFLVFLGASYLRAVARGQRYGLSARGLAVDTASPNGEEFPWFREFWIVKPKAKSKDKALTIYALLDGPRVAGAYAYQVRPGAETVLDVRSAVFLRAPVDKLGIAPLTSMFFLGENSSPREFDEFRPEIHDSDGLQVAFASGEWLWRPLRNPATLQVHSFEARDVRGFGLMQRDTDFDHYQDLEVRYEMHPSLWIEPKGDWGPGRVELVLIPTPNEMNDNVVAYWTPDVRPEPGKELRMDYTMRWLAAGAARPPSGWAAHTRSGDADHTRSGNEANVRLFVVDFEGKALSALPADAPVKAVVSVGEGGRLVEQQAFKNTVTGGWRLSFKVFMEGGSTLDRVLPDKRRPVEMRAFLIHGPDVMTETWSYAYKP